MALLLELLNKCPHGSKISVYLKREHNLLCFSLAEEEIKTEQEVVEGMDISTRSKVSKNLVLSIPQEEKWNSFFLVVVEQSSVAYEPRLQHSSHFEGWRL